MNVLFEDYRENLKRVLQDNIESDGDIDIESAIEDIWVDIIEIIIDKCDEELMRLEVKVEELEEELEDADTEIEE
jgi:hypothetical protein